MEYCSECQGKGWTILKNGTWKECPCVIKGKIFLYLQKVGKFEEPKKEVTKFIKKGLLTQGACQCILPPPMPLGEFQGVICKCLLWAWKSLSLPPSYKILNSYELIELWLGKRESDMGGSLFTFSEDILIIILSRLNNIANIRNPDIVKSVLFDRFRKRKTTWLMLHNATLGESLGITREDLSDLGVGILEFRERRSK